MAGGSIERLPRGRWCAVVRAGRDPITKRHLRLTEACATEGEAVAARERWLDVVDHEVSTARTTAGRWGHSDSGATTLRVDANWTRPADRRAVNLLAGAAETLPSAAEVSVRFG